MSYFVKIKLEKKISSIVIDVVNYISESAPGLDFFYEQVETDMVEAVDTSTEKFTAHAIVDEEGMLKVGNPAFEILVGDEKRALQLVGTILIGQSQLTEDGIDIVGFKTEEDAEEYARSMEISLIGFTA